MSFSLMFCIMYTHNYVCGYAHTHTHTQTNNQKIHTHLSIGDSSKVCTEIADRMDIKRSPIL